MLNQRIVSAAILIPLAALVAYLGGWWFFVAMILIGGLATSEFYSLMRSGGYRPSATIGVLTSIALLFDGRLPSLRLTGPILTAALVAALIRHLVAYERGGSSPAVDWGLTLGGGLYLGWMGSLFIRLRDLPDGLAWVALATIPVWIADSAAYFVGTRWGVHKCCPRLSPKKSWEGTVAGWATGTVATLLLGTALGLAAWQGLALGVILAALTPLGDLGESMFKRQVGAKDSGRLIPGHGGVLDRIDSLLFSAPIVYYFVIFLVERV